MIRRECFGSLVEASKDNSMYMSFRNILDAGEPILVRDVRTKLYRKVQFMLATAVIGIVLLIVMVTNYAVKYAKPPKLPCGSLSITRDSPRTRFLFVLYLFGRTRFGRFQGIQFVR